MHRHYRRHKFSTAVLNFLVAGIFVYAVWTGYKNYAFSGFDDGRINANSVLKEKKFDKMPVEISTPSGLKVWLIEDHTVPIIALSFIFERAGRAYDPDGQNGRAGIAANMLLYGAGTYNRRQFQDELELNGIQMAFSAGREDFSGMLANAAGLEQFDGAYHTIRLNDFITRPNGWVGLPMPDVAQVGDQEAGLLGIFTREKFNYILEVVPGLTYEDFESSTTMPTARARAIGDLVAISLQEAFDSGNPVLEADGRLMWVTGVSWKSYWGVPYEQGN